MEAFFAFVLEGEKSQTRQLGVEEQVNIGMGIRFFPRIGTEEINRFDLLGRMARSQSSDPVFQLGQGINPSRRAIGFIAFEERDDAPPRKARGRNNAVFIILKSPKGQADCRGGFFLGEAFLLAQRFDIHALIVCQLGVKKKTSAREVEAY